MPGDGSGWTPMDCDWYTKHLDGGEGMFSGQRFKIVLCGGVGNSTYNHDKIKLQVFDQTGTLRVVRTFHVDWSIGPIELKYGTDWLVYTDLTRGTGFEERITMPPSEWNGIRAKLSLVE